MNDTRQCYQELISLTQLFLFREHPLPRHFSLSIRKQEQEIVTPPSESPLPFSPPLSKQTLPSLPLLSPPLSPPPPPLLPESLIPSEKKEPVKENKKKWELEPLKIPPLSLDIEEFWTLFPPLFPHLRLSKSIPSDHEARKIKEQWSKEVETVILILSFGEEEKSAAFLKKMCQGISERLAPARVLPVSQIKKEEEWQQIFSLSSLRLIIASDYALYMHPQLMRYYREQPQQRKYFLCDKALLLLSDPSLYLKEPQLKSLLWRTICNEFASA